MVEVGDAHTLSMHQADQSSIHPCSPSAATSLRRGPGVQRVRHRGRASLRRQSELRGTRRCNRACMSMGCWHLRGAECTLSSASVRLRFASMLKAVTSGRFEGAFDDEKSEAASPVAVAVAFAVLLPSLAAPIAAIVRMGAPQGASMVVVRWWCWMRADRGAQAVPPLPACLLLPSSASDQQQQLHTQCEHDQISSHTDAISISVQAPLTSSQGAWHGAAWPGLAQ